MFIVFSTPVCISVSYTPYYELTFILLYYYHIHNFLSQQTRSVATTYPACIDMVQEGKTPPKLKTKYSYITSRVIYTSKPVIRKMLYQK